MQRAGYVADSVKTSLQNHFYFTVDYLKISNFISCSVSRSCNQNNAWIYARMTKQWMSGQKTTAHNICTTDQKGFSMASVLANKHDVGQEIFHLRASINILYPSSMRTERLHTRCFFKSSNALYHNSFLQMFRKKTVIDPVSTVSGAIVRNGLIEDCEHITVIWQDVFLWKMKNSWEFVVLLISNNVN